MSRTLGIVQPQPHGDGLRNRFSRKLGGKSWLEWAIHRAADSLRIDQWVVVLDDNEDSQAIAEFVPPDIPVFLGHGDPLRCFTDAMNQYAPAAVVRIAADNPFVDPVLIDRLVTSASGHEHCDYVSYCSQAGRPVIQSPLGILAEWCRADALRQADREATESVDRTEVTRYLYSHPEEFHLRLIPIPQQLDRNDVRLRMDVEEDWLHTETIYEALGPDALEWQQIIELLEVQPALRQRMAHLNRTLVPAKGRLAERNA